MAEQIEATSEAWVVILPTFDALEHDMLDALSTMFPKLYTIGPLELHLNQTSKSKFGSMRCNLWKEECECLKWLDSQQPNSVLYVNFGSVKASPYVCQNIIFVYFDSCLMLCWKQD